MKKNNVIATILAVTLALNATGIQADFCRRALRNFLKQTAGSSADWLWDGLTFRTERKLNNKIQKIENLENIKNLEILPIPLFKSDRYPHRRKIIKVFSKTNPTNYKQRLELTGKAFKEKLRTVRIKNVYDKLKSGAISLFAFGMSYLLYKISKQKPDYFKFAFGILGLLGLHHFLGLVINGKKSIRSLHAKNILDTFKELKKLVTEKEIKALLLENEMEKDAYIENLQELETLEKGEKNN